MGVISAKDRDRLDLSDRVASLHAESIVVDLHVDCIVQQRLFGYDVSLEHSAETTLARRYPRALPFEALRLGLSMRGDHRPIFNHADIPRLLRGGYNCAAFTVHFWPLPSEAAWREITRQLDYFDELTANDPRLLRASCPADIRQAAKQGKLAVFPVIEGFHCLGAPGTRTQTKRLDRIETVFRRGVRYITLTHFIRNDLACSEFGPGGSTTRGLSAFGRDVIRKMNEVGMIVDLAHVNSRGALEACDVSTKPVMASHTGFRGADPNIGKMRYAPRLQSDEVLTAIAQTGGVVGVFMTPRFLVGHNAPLSCIAQQYTYAIELLDKKIGNGARYLAFGSDLDGWIPSIPTDMNDAADLPRLTGALLDAGLTPQQIRGIWGENFMDFWDRVLSG